MPLQTSGKISYGDARSEGNKTSWVSPNYPNAGRQFDIDANWIISVDESNTIGYNPDGSFPITKVYGWDTWNRPTIEWAYLHQFAEDGGIRVVWKASGGDLWRTGWALAISSAGYPTPSNQSTLQFHYGPESNPNASDPKLQYRNGYGMNDRNISVLQGSVGWQEYDSFGGYSKTSKDPMSSLRATPDGTVEPTAYFSAVNELYAADNSTSYFATVIAYDARQHDSLGFARGDNVFTLDRLGGDYDSGPSKQATYGPGWAYLDGRVGDGSIILFNTQGNTIVGEVTDTTITLDVENKYNSYISGNNQYYWLYVTEDFQDMNIPYHFNDITLPSGHYYNTSTSDDYDVFGLDRWVRFQGSSSVAAVIEGLDADTQYRIFLLPFEQDDIDTGSGFSAPAKTEVDNLLNDGSDGVDVTTDTAPSLTSPSGFTIDGNVPGGFNCSWQHYGIVADGFEFRYKINGGSWQTSGSVSNETNWGNSTNPKSATFQPDGYNFGNTVEIQVRARKTGYSDSVYSNSDTYP